MRTLARPESGLVLTLVLVVFLFVELVVVGGLSLVMSDLQGAVAGQLAMQSLSVAEAGVNYGVAQLVERAALATDQEYAGEPEDIALPGANGRPLGTFSVTVACVYPRDLQPPACLDDPGTTDVDERDLRLIRSTGFIPARAARARRQIEVTVRRYVPAQGDIGVFGICGRDRVVLGPDTSLIGDVGSNADVTVDGPKQPPTVAGRVPAAPSVRAIERVTPVPAADRVHAVLGHGGGHEGEHQSCAHPCVPARPASHAAGASRDVEPVAVRRGRGVEQAVRVPDPPSALARSDPPPLGRLGEAVLAT